MGQVEATSILNRFNHGSDQEVPEVAYQPDDDYRPYGVSPHAVSLNCIGRDGNQAGLSWSLYCEARYDPNRGIEIEFTHKIVLIHGHKLLPLYQYVLGNRATFIAEADQATAKLRINEQESVVTKIEIEDRLKEDPQVNLVE